MSVKSEILYSEFIEAVKRDNGKYNTILTTGKAKGRFVAELTIKEFPLRIWWMRYERAMTSTSGPVVYITRNTLSEDDNSNEAIMDRHVYKMSMPKIKNLTAILEDYIIKDTAPDEFYFD